MSDNEIKAKFFAMYLRQKVWSEDSEREPISLTYLTDGGILHLRSIADLTDGEANNLMSLAYVKPFISKGEATKKHFIDRIDHIFEYLGGYQSDYLRSIGILLPYTYLNDQNEPITLTTEQIIEKGFAKYKEK